MTWWCIAPDNKEIKRRALRAFQMSIGRKRIVIDEETNNFHVDIARGHQNYISRIKSSFGGKLNARKSSYAEVQKILAKNPQR